MYLNSKPETLNLQQPNLGAVGGLLGEGSGLPQRVAYTLGLYSKGDDDDNHENHNHEQNKNLAILQL